MSEPMSKEELAEIETELCADKQCSYCLGKRKLLDEVQRLRLSSNCLGINGALFAEAGKKGLDSTGRKA